MPRHMWRRVGIPPSASGYWSLPQVHLIGILIGFMIWVSSQTTLQFPIHHFYNKQIHTLQQAKQKLDQIEQKERTCMIWGLKFTLLITPN